MNRLTISACPERVRAHRQDPRRQPFRNRHPRLPRRQRAGPEDRRDLGRGGQIFAAPLQGRRELSGRARPASRQGHGADRELSVDRGGDPRRQALGRRRDPSRLRPAVGKPGIRRGLRGGRHHLHRPEAGDDAPARQQGRGAQPGDRGRRAGHAGDRSAARRHGGGEEARRRDRLSGDAEGVLGRRRARHARHPQRSRPARAR